MSWRDTTLGEVLTLKRGYDLAARERKMGPYPIISSSGVTDWHAEFKVKGPGVVTGRYGTLGEVFYEERDFWPLNTSLYVQDFKGTHVRFAAYLLTTLNLGSQSGAAAVPGVNRNHLHGLPVHVPDFATQRRIADILSTYDDLIENNTRRIAILEDMARRLFEAWFLADAKAGLWVDLETLSEGKTGIQTGPFGSQLHKQDYSDDGVPVVMPKNMADLKIREEGIARIPSELAATMPRHILRDGDIVYGRRGDIGRRAFVTHREDGWFCGTGCLRIRPDKSKISPRYLFDALGLPETDGAIKGRAHGATMPNLSAGLMKSVPVFLPEKDVQERYAGLVDPLFELAASLEACTNNLRATRDLLLPKLISGEIEVRTAEEELEAAAA